MKKLMSLTAMTVIASGCAGVAPTSSIDNSTQIANAELQKNLAAGRERQEFPDKVKYKGNACAQKDQQPFEVSDSSLLDALKTYERQFNITISKHVDEPGTDARIGEKYFLFTDNLTGAQGLIDIHVIRNGEEICPKQNTDFKLISMDKVVYVPVTADTPLQRLPGVNIATKAAC